MMNFSFTKEQNLLREEIVAFAQAHLNEGAAQRDKEQCFDRDLWLECGKIGLPGLAIPIKYGGRGLGAISTVIALEALGYACEDGGLNFAISAHLLACLMPILLHASEEQKKEYLPSLCGGELVAGNAMTESTSGSDVFNMSTTAKPHEGGFKLKGTKSFVSNGPVADILVAYALTDAKKGFFGGISAFILDKRMHPFQTQNKLDKLGGRSCLLSEIHFDDLYVKANTVLGKLGGGGIMFSQSMDWERICLGAIHIGTMDRLLEKATKVFKKRKPAFEKHQMALHTLADLKIRLEAARLIMHKAAWKLEQGKSVNMEGSMTKLIVSETFKLLTLQLYEMMFNKTSDSDFERAMRDAIGSTIYSGTSEIHRNIIVRRMGII